MLYTLKRCLGWGQKTIGAYRWTLCPLSTPLNHFESICTFINEEKEKTVQKSDGFESTAIFQKIHLQILSNFPWY